MSVGGKVIETIDIGNRVWINTQENPSESCAIFVERTSQSLCISEGDSVWWQGSYAYWTPKNRQGKRVGSVEVRLKRIGFSGVSRKTAVLEKNNHEQKTI